MRTKKQAIERLIAVAEEFCSKPFENDPRAQSWQRAFKGALRGIKPVESKT